MSKILRCLGCVLFLVFVFQITVFGSSVNDSIVSDINKPVYISIPTVNIYSDILEYTNEMVSDSNGAIDPDYLSEVAWWSGGGYPQSDFSGFTDNPERIDFTVYLYGHSTNNDEKKVVFDDIDLLEVGDQITLTTEIGDFVYVVNDVFIVDKTDFTIDSRVLEDTPGRLLLISCWRSWSGSAPTTDNVVVAASLLSD